MSKPMDAIEKLIVMGWDDLKPTGQDLRFAEAQYIYLQAAAAEFENVATMIATDATKVVFINRGWKNLLKLRPVAAKKEPK